MRAQHMTLLGTTTLAGCILIAAAPPPKDTDTAPDGDVLRGPAVEETDAPGAATGFIQGDRDRARHRTRARMVRAIMRDMAGDDAPVGVRLTQEQLQRIREIVRAHRRAPAEPGSDVMRDGDARPPDANRPPRRVDTQGAWVDIWAILTKAQQAHIEHELERLAMQRVMDRRLSDAPEDDMAPSADAMPTDAVNFSAEMPERLRSLLIAMGPERRHALWTRLDAMLSGRRNGEKRPPPPMTDVRVPAPDDGDE